jgi:hypothetical protein
MPKTKISEFDVDPSNNTDINSINIAEGCAPSGINNAIRQLMSDLKEQQTGASGDNFTVGGNLAVTGTTVHTGATTFTGAVVFSSTVNGSALGNMANQNKTAVDITGGTITGITDLAVADGGTGRSTLTANAVLVGNGTSGINSVAPSTDDNVLISDGTSWTSAAIGTIAGFDKSLTANGYQKLPSGLLIQWGLTSGVAANTTVTITLPIAFTSGFVYANIAVQDFTGANEEMSLPFVGISGLSSFTVRNTDGDSAIDSYRWIAIGY